MKTIDLMVGVKSEQSLRDEFRKAAELGEEMEDIELVPYGKKDWIAGRRIGSSIQFGKLDEIVRSVIKRLIALSSFQRIRKESIRAYAVQPAVPVFKDFPDAGLAETPETKELDSVEKSDGSVTCPNCKRTVHTYNILRSPDKKIKGCYICRGEPKY